MHQLPGLGAPDVHALVEAARRQILAIRTECHRIHRLRVFRQRMRANAQIDVPQPYGGVERCAGQYERHIRIGRSRTGRRPFNRVDLLRVRLQIVHTIVLLHRPDFQRHVVGAAGQ